MHGAIGAVFNERRTVSGERQAETSAKKSAGSVGATGVVVSFVLFAALVGGAYAWANTSPAAPGVHRYTIRLTDYKFHPSHLTWHVGDRVSITLVNDSGAHPGKAHEWMLGRKPLRTSTPFGSKITEGFQMPFFKGITVHIDSGAGLKMMGAGPAKLTGKSPMSVLTPQARARMMKMKKMGGMKKMAGFMPLLTKGGRVTFSFRVPDKPGTWTYACFQQDGQHFLNGMRGTVEVKE